MEFAWHGPAQIGDISQVLLAEQLGYTSAWFTDSHMMWSDVYATMAVVATRTKTIRLGTGVGVAGTRLAPVSAAAIASVNRVAPGRAFLSVASGNTSWRLMGQRPPLKVAEIEEYVRVVRELLAGHEVPYTFNGHTAPIGFRTQTDTAIDIDHHIPVYVVGAGPRMRAVAGRVGDGIVDALPSRPEGIRTLLDHVHAGADEVGRTLPDDFTVSAGVTVIVLDKDEDIMADRVVAQAGPMVMKKLHVLYAIHNEGSKKLGAGGRSPRALPEYVTPIWEKYCALFDAMSPEERHQRVNDGDMTYTHPDELQFVTPETIRASMVIGRPEEVIEQIRAFDAAGVDNFWLTTIPGPEGTEGLERFSRLVMSKL